MHGVDIKYEIITKCLSLSECTFFKMRIHLISFWFSEWFLMFWLWLFCPRFSLIL